MLIAALILFPMLAAPALFALGRRDGRPLFGAASLCAAVELALSLALLPESEALALPGVLGGLRFAADGFRRCYGLLASLLWLGSALFSREYFDREREHLASYWAMMFLTLGAVQGLFLSADFMTAFIFFELLSLSSFPWVMHEREEGAIRAGYTYLAIAIFGGMVLFMGLLLLQREAGTLAFAELPAALAGADAGRTRAAAVCLLLGFGAKAGMFPLHIWLPKAHPVAPAPASALLSGMLTKAGVYGVLMTALYVCAGDRLFGVLLLTLALVTMLLGAVLALFAGNLKRVLACSSMSQIGFILTGVASVLLCGAAEEGRALALTGAMLHMANHSLLKLALFLSAGTVAMRAHALGLNEIRGWGWNKPVFRAVFDVAALGISGVPLFCGYLSKTLLHEGLLEAVRASGLWAGTEWLFLAAGGMTFAYMLKLHFCLFREYNADPARQREYDVDRRGMRPLSAGVLLCCAAALLALGLPPVALALGGAMSGGAPGHFASFAWENLKGAAISLLFGAALYLGFVRPVLEKGGVYRDRWPRRLDLEDSVYRPALRLLCLIGSVIGRALETALDALATALLRSVLREEKLRDAGSIRRAGTLRALGQAASTALGRVRDNFSVAMMMTCVGVILIFGFLVLLT